MTIRSSKTAPVKYVIGLVALVFIFVAVFLAASLPGIHGTDGAFASAAEGIGDWQRSAGAGFGNGSDSFMADPLVSYNGLLYAGVSNQKGAEVRVKQGDQWNVVSPAPGFGDANNMAILSMHVYQNRLYVGTFNFAYGCEIWRYDGSTWTKMVGRTVSPNSGFGSPYNMAAVCMEEYNGKLYVGTLNVYINATTFSVLSNGAEVWAYDGSNWSKASGGGFGDTSNFGVTSLKEYNGNLYAGTIRVAAALEVDPWNMVAVVRLNSLGCQLWRQGTTVWQKIADNGLTRVDNAAIVSMEVYNGMLWLGTLSGNITLHAKLSPFGIDGVTWDSKGLCIYSYNGSVLTPNIEGGFSSANEIAAFSMTTANVEGKELLLVGAGKMAGGSATEMTSEVAASDGNNWYSAAPDGFGNAKNMGVMSLLNANGTVWAGTLNADEGCEIWSVQPATPPEPLTLATFYFAEGTTRSGFQEYFSIGNPGDQAAKATITYMFPGGGTQAQEVDIPADSRASVDVNSAVGADKDVSAKIESDQKIIAERPMYFNYQGHWSGGSDTVGVTDPSLAFYFAEGYTGPGFDEWICVLNPGDAQANLSFSFQTEEEGEKKVEGNSVPPHSRASFKANQLLGGKSYQTSLKLTSDQPVVAERPMYFDYTGTGNWHWTGGHCVMGATSLDKSYYFAEGTTRAGFEEWLTLQNPNSEGITIHATYQLGPGQGDPIEKDYPVGAGKRYTVPVNKEIGADKDVSVYLSSASDFLAERPMYFKYSYTGLTATGGHCVIGASQAASEWFLAEGYTGGGFNEWLCLQNPGDSPSTVEITYYTQEKGALPPKVMTIPAKSRATVMVNEDAGSGYQLSTRIKVTQGSNIIVERPMYFIFRGWDGGHDVVGYAQ